MIQQSHFSEYMQSKWKISITIFIAALLLMAKKWDILFDKLIKMPHTHTEEYHPAFRKKECLPFVMS
jgi:hypothetical protein